MTADQAPALAFDSPSIRTRVDQIHRLALNSLYASNYYGEMARRTLRYSKHFDFLIGLGAALSGGTGLGILGHPNFAWLCGIVTTGSVVLTAAKSAYDWPGRVKQSTEISTKYGILYGKCKMMIDDLNYRQSLTANDETTFQKLREEEANFDIPALPDLPIEVQRDIQNDIKNRIQYKNWWRP